MLNNHFFIFAGEHSGDLHGSHLAKAIKTLAPTINLEGVPGPKMRVQGVASILQMEDFEVMGFSDVIRSLPKLIRQFYQLRNHILSTKPQAVILIDYPGFNLRLAAALRKKGYQGKIIQYISPSVWAWGKHRIALMANTLDLLLTIYPFEKQCFADTSLHVKYVGNPLCDYIKSYAYDDVWQKKLHIPPTNNLIALFPGSREGEVNRNLPYLLEMAMEIKKKYPDAVFGISALCSISIPNIATHPLAKSLFFIPKTFTYELMRDSQTAVAKSGTVTLELAIHNRPTIVFYKLSKLNRLYATYFVKPSLKHFCIVNILGDKEIFPELIEKEVSASLLLESFLTMHEDKKKRAECIKNCEAIRHSLEQNNASLSAAKAIMNCIFPCTSHCTSLC